MTFTPELHKCAFPGCDVHPTSAAQCPGHVEGDLCPWVRRDNPEQIVCKAHSQCAGTHWKETQFFYPDADTKKRLAKAKAALEKELKAAKPMTTAGSSTMPEKPWWEKEPLK